MPGYIHINFYNYSTPVGIHIFIYEDLLTHEVVSPPRFILAISAIFETLHLRILAIY